MYKKYTEIYTTIVCNITVELEIRLTLAKMLRLENDCKHHQSIAIGVRYLYT